MEEFKIEHYNKVNKEKPFPKFSSLEATECLLIKERILIKIQNKTSFKTDVELMISLRENSTSIPDFNASTAGFNLREVFEKYQILVPEEIYINWYRFDKIDRFKFADLNNNFGFIWYPGVDDIDMFSEELNWIISIDDSGFIYLFKG